MRSAVVLVGWRCPSKFTRVMIAPRDDRAQRIAKAKAAADSKTLTKGSIVESSRYFLLRDSLSLSELGLPPGVILMLKLGGECALFFAAIFALQYWALQRDNAERGNLRTECRLAAADGESLEGCGYGDLPISRTAPELRGLALLGYGACSEYTDSGGRFGKFVRVDSSSFCAAGGLDPRAIAYWFLDLLAVLILLWRLQRLERLVTQRADALLWTAADYTVMIKGLDQAVPATDAMAALSSDLAVIGFGAGAIDHLECGLLVKKEAAARAAVLEARQQLAAAAAKSVMAPHGAAASAADEEQSLMAARCSARELQLAALLREPQRTTGHAFVVLQLETDRNRLVKTIQAAGGELTAGGVALFPRAASKANGRGVAAMLAPEPSNICWENLEVSDEERHSRFRATLRNTLLLLIASGGLLVLIQWAKRTFTTDFAVGDALGKGEWASQLEADPSIAICLLAALTIAVVAARVRGTVQEWHAAEAHETRGESEAGLLWKLCGAFTTNNVLTPVAVSMVQSYLTSGDPVSQAMYERTGFITMAVVIMSVQRVTADLPRALQLLTLLGRHCRAPFCASENQVPALFEPPSMRIALQMAQLYWLIACALLCNHSMGYKPTGLATLAAATHSAAPLPLAPCLLPHPWLSDESPVSTPHACTPMSMCVLEDGPLAPFFYLLASGYCAWSYACTKVHISSAASDCLLPAAPLLVSSSATLLLVPLLVSSSSTRFRVSRSCAPSRSCCLQFGITFWYQLPPAIDVRLGAMLRRMIWLLLPLHLLVKLLVRLAAEPVAFAPFSFAYYAAAHVACACAMYLTGELTSSPFVSEASSPTFESSQQLEALDTDGIRYADVPLAKGYAIDAYRNPYRRVRDERWTPSGFFGAPAPPAGAAEGASETVDQNTAALSASLPMEDLPLSPFDSLAESGF